MRLVVGMSGGVDSSLAAALLAEQGHEVLGVTMQLWPCADLGAAARADACCSPREAADARAAALAAGVRHRVVDMSEAFQREIVDAFAAACAAGRTPSPCVTCNEKLKFGTLWEWARTVGAERVATGHYARTAQRGGRWLPAAAADPAKDQTYFLFSLTQEQLAAAEFPLGHLTKAEVRVQAAARGLPTAAKRESQDLCFVGPEGVAGWLRAHAPGAVAPGPILHADGRRLGQHAGLAGFTIGQRHGLGIAWHEPLFVVGLDAAANAVVVGPHAALLTASIDLEDCTWHLGGLPPDGLACRVRLRHRGALLPAHIVARPGSGPRGLPNAAVHFTSPQARTGAGQACVAYEDAGALCLGGGWVAG